jgi:2-methylcitrate dehydratase
MKTSQTEQIARFIHSSGNRPPDPGITDQLKKHLLDSIGSLIHAANRPTIEKLRRQLFSMGEGGACRVPGSRKLPVDRAAQYFTALIRYPDFMDNFLGKEATCHPCDNIGGLLAAAQLKDVSGADFLKAMALGYEIECRLVEEIPVMMKGFDHTVLLAYSLTGALCQLLQLTPDQTAHALSIAGCSQNPLVTCRASYTYEWKGFASSLVALNCLNIALLAKEDLTGPLSLFEGPKGFNDIFGMELDYNWEKEDFSLIRKCILKTFNAEVHTQPALEAARILKEKNDFDPADIRSVDATVFLTAYHIVGGGSYGDRKTVQSKEQADHSLPYALSAVLLDGGLYPEQLLPERIIQPDIQELLQKVNVHTRFPVHKPLVLAGILDPYTEAYPEQLMSTVKIHFANGKSIERENINYRGFHTDPLSWDETEKKFNRLTSFLNPGEQMRIVEVVRDLDKQPVGNLMALLAKLPCSS